MIRTLALLAFAETADFGTTWLASTRGAHEGNPVFLAAAGSGFLAAFVIAKLGVIPLVGTVIGFAPTERAGRIINKAAQYAAWMLLGVAASNVLVAL